MPTHYPDFYAIAEEFCQFIRKHSDMFVCHRRDNSPTAYRYLCGLIQSDRANMERMDERVEDSEYENFQQFIADSPWSARAVYDRVAVEANRLLGGGVETALIIDETAFSKKGKGSVGVTRQWDGRLGKVENCQVGVFGAIASGERVVPIDARLYLPEEWAKDPERCAKVGVPEEEQRYRSKPELALEVVRHQRGLGVEFGYVSADGLYGNSGVFSRSLDDEGEVFLMHVHADQHVYLEDPEPSVPSPKNSRGRRPSRLKAQTDSIRVDALAKQLGSSEWERVVVRATTKGPLVADIHRRIVWVWDGEEEQARRWQLLIKRPCAAGQEMRYCLTNTSPAQSAITLARMEAQRFWIERAFEDGKKEAGMADYQVRGWNGWHHHMALVLMALLFMTQYRMLMKNTAPLLSCHDIRILLAHFLPRGDATTDEVVAQLERRHEKRKAASKSAFNRHQKDPP